MKSIVTTPKQRMLSVVLLIFVASSSAQTGSVRITLWKNGARGAYSMSGDDYACQYYGNLTTIDTTTANRGIHMGLTTVSDFPSCLGSCSEPYWEFARTVLVPHGHELITHSYDHQWHLKTQAALALILDTSQAHIEAHVPANECLFFGDYGGMWSDSMIKIGPFYQPLEPQPTMKDSMVNYMKHQEFIGARMGGTALAQCPGTNPSSYDPFRTEYVIWLNGGVTEHELFQQRVQCAIDNGGHLNYEFHNIGESVSWSPVNYSDWVTVLNYLKGKVDAGELWVETPQRVTKYMMERDNYTVAITAQGASTMQIEFNTSVEVNPSPMIANSVYNEPLTLVITTPYGHSVRVNAAPFGGPITVQFTADGVQSVTQNGVPLQEIPVGVAQSRPALTAGRGAVTALTRQPSGILVNNPSGRAVTVRVYALSGRCVLDEVARGPDAAVGTRGLAPGFYTAVAGSASLSFAVQPQGR